MKRFLTKKQDRAIFLAAAGLVSLLLCATAILSPVSNAKHTPVSVEKGTASISAQPGKPKYRKPEFVAGEVLVRFKHDQAIEGTVSVAVPHETRGRPVTAAPNEKILIKIDRFEGSNLVDGLRLAHTMQRDTWKAIVALRARTDVLYAEPNYLRHADDNIPNDPSFGSLYGMTKIAAPQAWDTTQGSNSIVVGVIDEGIQLDHPDLQANIWTNPSPGSIPGISGDLHGYDFINNSGTIPPEDHASHVGGTVGAVNSYGGAPFSQAFSDAISALNSSNILFVAAAGNDGTNNDVNPHYPSSYQLPNVMAVTATDSNDQQVFNYGAQTVLLGAPGVGILSTVPPSTYQFFSGTSMATPHVAGAAALLLAKDPTLTVNQLRSLLAYNGDVIPSLQGKTVTGRRLNVFKSLQALNENDTTPPGVVGSFQIASQTGRTVNLSWIASGDDGPTGQASLYDISFIDVYNNAVIPLTTILPATTGTPQNTTVNIPYRHTSGTIKLREFDNVGNEGTPSTIQVSVDPFLADPYAASTATHEALSTGGTAVGLTQDDAYISAYSLPFSFPFFGQNFSTVRISTNGALYFSTRTDNDSQSSIGGLPQFKMIAGMWDDLDLRTSRRADADVYVVTPSAGRIIFRWQGVQFGDGVNGDPINFEIELNSDGTVKTRYGSGNTNLFPVVGISGGERDVYFLSSLTSDRNSDVPIDLTNAQNGLFAPRNNGLKIDSTSALAGRTSGGQQIVLNGSFPGLSTVTMGGASASFISQHILELRQAVDAMRAVAGLSGASWSDPSLVAGNTIKAVHITELRTFLDDAATRLGFSTSTYTDPGLTAGFAIKRIHIEELRQRIRTIAG